MTTASPLQRAAADTTAWWSMTTEEAARALASDTRKGLSTAEAAARLRDGAPNALAERPPKPAWRMAVDQVANTIIVVLLAAALVTVFVGDPRDTIVIAIVVVLNGAIGFYQERQAQHAMAALKRLTTTEAHVVRDGEVRVIPAPGVVRGDVMRLQAGDIVAADGRLVEAAALRIDEAPLTGESVPVDKTGAPTASVDAPLAERASMVFKGTAVVAGRGVVLVTATGMATELGRIAGVLAGEAPPTPLQRRLATLGQQIAIGALALSAVVAVIGVISGQPVARMLLTGVSLAVAAIPESLPAVVTIALALGAQRMAKQHAVIRKLLAVETLGSVTVIGTDKTGTLTRGEMEVELVWTPHDGEFRVEGEGYAPTGRIAGIDGGAHLPHDVEHLLRAAVLCNDASVLQPRAGERAWRAAGDPTEAALLALAAKAGMSRAKLAHAYPRTLEVPFSAERRRMTTVHGHERLTLVVTKGAMEAVLPLVGDGSAAADARHRAHDYGQRGYRVLAFAGAEPINGVAAGAEEATPLEFYGLVAMTDPPRPDAAPAIAAARSAGVRTVMISGDQPATAHAIAVRLGIIDGGAAMTGAELAKETAQGSDEHLREVAVFARTTSEQKLGLVQAWQAEGEIVAMTGDGINDAPALRRADIGVAMGVNGTEVAKEAADMVLADDNFATIVSAIREGRRIYDNIRRFVRYGLTGGSAEVWVMLAGPFLGMPLPLLPVQILWVNLLTHGLPGLALGVEPAEPDTMRRPPRRPNEMILGRGLWQHVAVMGVFTACVTVGLGLWERSHGGPWQTMMFTALALLQLGNAFAVRSERQSVFGIGLFSNRFLTLAVAITLLLQFAVIYLGPLRDAFVTEPLGWVDLLTVLAVSTATFWAVELDKLVRRLSRSRRPHRGGAEAASPHRDHHSTPPASPVTPEARR